MKTLKKFKTPAQSILTSKRLLGIAFPILALLLLLLSGCTNNPSSAPVDEVTDSTQVQSSPELENSTQSSAPPAAENASDAPNPCELLTADEFESFFGEAAAPGAEPENLGPYGSCMVWNQSGNKFITLQVAHQTAEQFKDELDTSAAMLDLELVPVEGLGDEAVYFSGLLHVRVGETVLQVLTWYQDVDQALDVTRQIANLVIPRLP
jgi:hypothetical protein